MAPGQSRQPSANLAQGKTRPHEVVGFDDFLVRLLQLVDRNHAEERDVYDTDSAVR